MNPDRPRRSISPESQPTRDSFILREGEVPTGMAKAYRRANESGESDSSQPSEAVQFMPLDWILPAQYQPRQYFDENALQELTASVKESGILQPLLVRPVRDKYELVAGERRYRAAIEAGLTSVPVTVKEMTAEQALQYALVENLQREDLNPVEETEGILRLLELNLKTDRSSVIALLNQMAKAKRGLADSAVRQEEQQIIASVFQSIGRLSPESFRSHRLPILNLPAEILAELRKCRIDYTKAKEIAKLESEEEWVALLEEAIAQSLTLRQVQKRVKEKKCPRERSNLKAEMEGISKRFSKFKVWNDPDKRSKLESLLAEIEALLSDED